MGNRLGLERLILGGIWNVNVCYCPIGSSEYLSFEGAGVEPNKTLLGSIGRGGVTLPCQCRTSDCPAGDRIPISLFMDPEALATERSLKIPVSLGLQTRH